jgi:hypothetical protein
MNAGMIGEDPTASLPRSVSSSRVGEVAEVLESETHVDMEKLLSLAHQGVPDELRAEAWKYMLGVSRSERAEEMSLRKSMETDYKENENAWRSRPHGELARAVKAAVLPHRQALSHKDDAAMSLQLYARLESLLCCYLHAQGEHGEELRAGTVQLLLPFVHIYSSDVDAYYCFAELMKRLEWALTFDGCKQMTVAFMTLLRHMLPELYSFLEEEQSCGGAWLASWLQFFLARDLPLPCLLRLWDTYFAYDASYGREATLQLHIYVCLAILEACDDEIMELDDSDMLWYLTHLPSLDMGKIVLHALNIKDDVIASSIL